MVKSKALKNKESDKFGNVVAPNLSLDKANKVRSSIKQNTKGYWVFVAKNPKTGKYNVSVQNTWGASLNGQELYEVKQVVKKAKAFNKTDVSDKTA